MQILASALPGFRDLRAPLTAGYLWLILLWMALKPDLTTRPTNEVAGSIYDLGKSVGPLWLGLAVSVAAYLIGSVSHSFSPQLINLATRLSGRISRKSASNAANSHSQTENEIFDIISRLENRGKQRIGGGDARQNWRILRDDRDPIYQYERLISARTWAARRSLQVELDLPATLLLGKEPELFSEADRLKAESQLRLAVVPPLTVISGFLTAQHVAWAAILIAVGVLWWQGYRRELEFKSLMLGAFQLGIVRSQAIDDFRDFVDALPTAKELADERERIAAPKRDDA